MNLGDLFLLKIGSYIKIPQRLISKIPYVMFIFGVIVAVKMFSVSGAYVGNYVYDVPSENNAISDNRIVENGDYVTLFYSGRFEDNYSYGTVAWQIVSFTAGNKEMTPGIDNAIRDMKIGETK